MGHSSSLAQRIVPSDCGMHTLAMPSLDHMKVISTQSGQLHSLPMTPALSLVQKTFEYGTYSPGILSLDHFERIQVQSTPLHSPPMVPSSSLAQTTALFECGMYAQTMLLSNRSQIPLPMHCY